MTKVKSIEQWRPIQGFEELYAISDRGRVKRTAPGNSSTYVGKILKLQLHPKFGYLNIILYKDGKQYGRRVNRLVAQAFVEGDAPGLEAHHKDDVKTHNWAGNLEWLSSAEHHKRTTQRGLIPSGEQHCKSKLTEMQVAEIRGRYAQGGVLQRELAKEYGVDQVNISRIVRGETWKQAVSVTEAVA
jgi:hypothetical protein